MDKPLKKMVKLKKSQKTRRKVMSKTHNCLLMPTYQILHLFVPLLESESLSSERSLQQKAKMEKR